jgi:hypothetical protein
MMTEKADKTGYLIKSGGANMLMGVRFNKRFFALCDDHMYYYTSHEKLDEPRGAIPLDADTKLSKEEATGGKEATKFQVMTKDRVYVLIADTEQDAMDWLNAIKNRLSKIREAAASDSVSDGLQNMSIAAMQGFLYKRKQVKETRKRSSITQTLARMNSSSPWQKRYFVLSQGRLRWMLEDATGEVLNFIDLKEPGVGVKLDDASSDRPFCFTLTSGSGVRCLSAESDQERSAWVTALEKNIVLGQVHQQGTASKLHHQASTFENFVGAEVADTGMELQSAEVATAKATGGLV